MRRPVSHLLALLAAWLALPSLVHADEARTALFSLRYDVDSTSVTYCRLEGKGGDPFADPQTQPMTPAGLTPKVATSGSSKSVAAVTALSAPFAAISVGDVLYVKRATTTDVVLVTAKADSDTITVDTAVDWSTDLNGTAGVTFTWKKLRCGTAATDGWIDVQGANSSTIVVEFNQGDITSLEWRLEGRACPNTSNPAICNPVVLYPGTAVNCGPDGTVVSGFCDFLAAKVGITGRHAVLDITNWSSFRVGFKYVTADAADTTTDLEQLTAYITVSQVRR